MLTARTGVKKEIFIVIFDTIINNEVNAPYSFLQERVIYLPIFKLALFTNFHFVIFFFFIIYHDFLKVHPPSLEIEQ